MSAIDSRLQELQREVGYWADQQRGYESKVRECAQKADILKARIAGVREAIELIAKDAVAQPAAETVASEKPAGGVTINVRKRQRSLTGHWQQIMQLVDGYEGFDYDTLAAAVDTVGHDANRDTLRSQMSLYKQGGLVDAIGDGRFRLTDAGRRAAGITGDHSPNENAPPSSAFNDVLGGADTAIEAE